MNNKSIKRDGTFFVFLAGICWGVISIFINRLKSEGFDSLQISCIRSWFSVLELSVFFIIRDKSLFKIKLRDIWIFVGTGILSLTFFSYCYFTTIINLGAAVAVVLLYTSPVFVMLMSAVIFKEKINTRKIIGLVFTIMGCIFIAGLIGNASTFSLGTFLIGLGAGFGYALYSIFGNVATKKYSSLTITFYTLLLSGISLLVICKPVDLVRRTNYSHILWFLGVSFICTVIPYIAYTYGLSKMEPGKAAVLVTVEPLVGCIFGIFVWHEEFNIIKLIGMIFIFAAILLFSLKAKE